MLNRLANLWRALRDRGARWRDGAPREVPDKDTARVLQQWLDCSRDDVRREQAELVREREEVGRLRAENDRLRDDVERLKLDNRALLNSLLGTAGIPPLEVPRTGEVPPVRRPSWPQIAAKREVAAGRKVEQARRQHEEKVRNV